MRHYPAETSSPEVVALSAQTFDRGLFSLASIEQAPGAKGRCEVEKLNVLREFIQSGLHPLGIILRQG